mgnify:CR=1 FL=1
MFPVLKDNFRRYNNLSTQPPIWNKTERTKNRFVSWNVLLQDILKDNERISHKQAVEKAYQEYDIFNKTQPIESDFDKVVKGLAKAEN